MFFTIYQRKKNKITSFYDLNTIKSISQKNVVLTFPAVSWKCGNVFLLQHCSDLYNIYDCTTCTDVLCVFTVQRLIQLQMLCVMIHVLLLTCSNTAAAVHECPSKKKKKQSGFLQIYDMGDSSNINTLYHRHSEEKDFGMKTYIWDYYPVSLKHF